MASISPAAPFHVLLLAGANRSPSQLKKKKEEGDQDQAGNNNKDALLLFDTLDDYLYRRNEFRKKKKKQQQARISAAAKNVGFNNNQQPKQQTQQQGEESSEDDALSKLRALSSPLELAMAACCERVPLNNDAEDSKASDLPSPKSSSPSQHHSRQRLHRPLFPANYVAPDPPDDSSNDNIMKHQQEAEYESNNNSSSSSSSSIDNKKYECILKSGREGHFTKLLLLYCCSSNTNKGTTSSSGGTTTYEGLAGHRALALGILQRTVEWEVKQQQQRQQNNNNTKLKKEGEQVKKDEDEETDDGINGKSNEGGKNDSESKGVNGQTDSESKRAKTFLATGGMKLLARWLVEAYTVVPAPSSPNMLYKKQIHGKHNVHSIPHVASPTGCLLLPLLQLLKLIPFDKKLVVSTQINKSIKRLKKALDVIVKGCLDPATINNVVHPIAGGLSVGKVRSAVVNVMESWQEAATKDSNEDVQSKYDPFQSIEQKIQARFDELARFHNEGGSPPEWCPKSVLGRLRLAGLPKFEAAANKADSLLRNTSTTSSLPIMPTHAKAMDNSNAAAAVGASSTETKRQQKPWGTIQGLMASKRSAAAGNMFIDPPARKMQKRNSASDNVPSSLSSPRKKVSWTDRPIGRNLPLRPLKNVRVFVKQEEYVPPEPEVPPVLHYAKEEGLHEVTQIVKEEEFEDELFGNAKEGQASAADASSIMGGEMVSSPYSSQPPLAAADILTNEGMQDILSQLTTPNTAAQPTQQGINATNIGGTSVNHSDNLMGNVADVGSQDVMIAVQGVKDILQELAPVTSPAAVAPATQMDEEHDVDDDDDDSDMEDLF